MMRKLPLLLVFCVGLVVLSQLGRLNGVRMAADRFLLYPVLSSARNMLFGKVSLQAKEAFEKENLQEQLRELKAENGKLRQQLGSIPEEGSLFPASVIWVTPGEMIVRFPYSGQAVPQRTPVVFGKLFVGVVYRAEGETLVVHKATDSSFAMEGKTEKGIQGKILGSFNEEVRFETGTDSALAKGDRVYAVDRVSGGMYLVGTVGKILLNQRLPVKSAVVNYYAGDALLDTVFILLK